MVLRNSRQNFQQTKPFCKINDLKWQQFTHRNLYRYIQIYKRMYTERVDIGKMAMEHTPHSQKLQHWNFTIRWLSIIFNQLAGILLLYRVHHHHVVLVARISLTLSYHASLSFIALGRSSGQHPISSHSCWMYVRAGRPAFARPCVGVYKSTSLMSSSLLLQQCPACLVRLTWIVFVIGGWWLYSWCFVGCCRQDLFKIARSILV